MELCKPGGDPSVLDKDGVALGQSGLRWEEAMKIQPMMADQSDHLFLKGSWTKGGRERIVSIRTEAQREVIKRATSSGANT